MSNNLLQKQLKIALSPISHLLENDHVTDIIIQGHQKVIIKEQSKEFRIEGIQWATNDDLKTACGMIARHIRRKLNEENPILDARLPDGTRVNIIFPPVYQNGACVSIRKFPKKKLLFDDLIEFGSISQEGINLLKELVEQKNHIIISGGTGTGKTTLLNIMSGFIHPSDNVITIEDTRELELQTPIWTALETKQKIYDSDREITLRDLVKTALRMAPRWIILGEVRGPEAFDLLRALNTGHAGMGTIHADSSLDALYALENCVQQGMDIKIDYIRPYVSRAIDYVINIKRLNDESIKISNISRVMGIDHNNAVPQYKIQPLLLFQNGEFTTREVRDMEDPK